MAAPDLLVSKLGYKTGLPNAAVSTQEDFEKMVIVPVHMRRHSSLLRLSTWQQEKVTRTTGHDSLRLLLQ